MSSLNVLFRLFSRTGKTTTITVSTRNWKGVESIIRILIIAVTYSRSSSTHILSTILTSSNTTNRMFPVATETNRLTIKQSIYTTADLLHRTPTSIWHQWWTLDSVDRRITSSRRCIRCGCIETNKLGNALYIVICFMWCSTTPNSKRIWTLKIKEIWRRWFERWCAYSFDLTNRCDCYIPLGSSWLLDIYDT